MLMGLAAMACAIGFSSGCSGTTRPFTSTTSAREAVPLSCQGLFWYDFSQEDSDPAYYCKIDYEHWGKLGRTSNHVMVKQRDFDTDPEGWALLLDRIKREGWPGASFWGISTS